MSAARCVWPVGAVLGEGPLWSARENALYFVDMKKPALHRLSLGDGAQTSWQMPEMLGWVVERRDRPGFIAGFRSGFCTLTLTPFEIARIGAPEPERTQNRLNDAKADAVGRIWAGSMDDTIRAATGALYRLDPDHSWTRLDDGYGVTNGPTFSLAGDALYHADSLHRVVYRFDLAPDGAIANKRDFIRFQDDWGYPDGMATDSEGCLWIAHWAGARVSRFTPDGKLERSIALPVSRPTSCTFAGADLDRLFVTTSSDGVAGEALAGGLFEIDPGVRGLPTHAFAG